MGRCLALLLSVGALAPSSTAAASTGLTPAQAIGLLGVNPEAAGTTSATWNGRPTVFVDYLAGPEAEQDRHVLLVQRGTGAPLLIARVTVGEPNGGNAEVAAIGFANADGDRAKELILLLKWRVIHYDVSGSLYEVRLFDDLKPGQDVLSPLTDLSRRFGSECDCEWRDGSKKRFQFQTIAAVKARLKQLGY